MSNRIGLADADSRNFPNLALMKLSAWHKARGDVVDWAAGLRAVRPRVCQQNLHVHAGRLHPVQCRRKSAMLLLVLNCHVFKNSQKLGLTNSIARDIIDTLR